MLPMYSYGMGMTYGMGNAYQNVKSMYGYGPVDYAKHPKMAEYPMETIPQPPFHNVKKSWLGKIVNKIFS